MASHEVPAAVHDHIAADYARRRALELIARIDLPLTHDEQQEWMGQATEILRELARG